MSDPNPDCNKGARPAGPITHACMSHPMHRPVLRDEYPQAAVDALDALVAQGYGDVPPDWWVEINHAAPGLWTFHMAVQGGPDICAGTVCLEPSVSGWEWEILEDLERVHGLKRGRALPEEPEAPWIGVVLFDAINDLDYHTGLLLADFHRTLAWALALSER